VGRRVGFINESPKKESKEKESKVEKEREP
jgi:hypothetical protein